MTLLFNQLDIESAFALRDVQVPLRRQGLVLLTGRHTHLDNSNFSGKTSIWDTLAHVLTGQTTKLNERRQALANDALIHRDYPKAGYHAAVSFANSKGDFLIDEARNHPSLGTRLKIARDNKFIEMKNLQRAKKQRAAIVPLTHEELMSLVILTARYTNLLVQGTATNRVKYLEMLLRLTVYNGLSKMAKEEEGALGADLDRVDRVKTELRVQRRNAKALPSLEDASQAVAELEERQRELSDLLESVRRATTRLETRLRHSQKYASLMTRISELHPSGGIPLEQAEAELDAAETQLATAQETSRVTEQRAALTEQLCALGKLTRTREEALQRYQRAEESLRRLNQRVVANKRRRALELELHRVTTALEATPITVTAQAARDELAAINLRLRTLSERSGILERLHDACPVCDRRLTRKAALGLSAKDAEERKTLQGKRKQAARKVQKAEEAQELQREATRLRCEIKQLPAKLRGAQERCDALRRRIAKYRASLEKYGASATLRQQLESLPECSGSVSKPRLKELQIAVTKARKSVRIAEQVNSLTHEAEEEAQLLKGRTDPMFWQRKLKKKAASVASLSTDARDATEALGNARAKLAEVERAAQRLTRLTKRVKKLRKVARRHEALKALQVAFSNSGMKADRMRASAESIVRLLPKYSRLLLPANNLALRIREQALGFTVKVENKGVEVDARSCSSSELFCLFLSLLLATRAVIPPDKRSNFIVLDEAPSVCDTATVEHVCQALKEIRSDDGLDSVFVTLQDQHMTACDTSFADQTWVAEHDGQFTSLYR